MIISCEGCSKRYLMDDGLMSSGPQMLRCAACGHVWTYSPAPALEPLSAIPETQQAAEGAPPGNSRSSAKGIGLVASVLFTLTLTGAYFARTSIVQTWPHVSPLFEFLGLTSQPLSHSLKVINVHTMEDEAGAVVVMGEIENIAREAKSLASLRMSALGPCDRASFYIRTREQLKGVFTGKKDACPLLSWTHSMSQSRLLPQEKLGFQTQPQALPKDTQQIAIEFS